MGISKEFAFSQTQFGATTFEGGKHAHKRLKKEAGSKGKETPVLQIPCSFLAFGMKCKEYNSLHLVAPTIQFFTFGISHNTILYISSQKLKRSTEFEELESLFL